MFTFYKFFFYLKSSLKSHISINSIAQKMIKVSQYVLEDLSKGAYHIGSPQALTMELGMPRAIAGSLWRLSCN